MLVSGKLFRPWMACALVVLAATAASAQATANEHAAVERSPVDPAPVAYASASEVNGILAQVRQTAQSIDDDLGKTRVEKWKGDASFKGETQGTIESVRRNLQSALPEMVSALSNAPEDLAASFKLYRNLDALYDILGQIVERAGDRGTKDEYQNLNNDLSSLQSARRALGERMQSLATAKESELKRLHDQVKAAQAAATPSPAPKKIIVDDTEPPKKPVKKKAPAKPAATTTTTPPPASAPK